MLTERKTIPVPSAKGLEVIRELVGESFSGLHFFGADARPAREQACVEARDYITALLEWKRIHETSPAPDCWSLNEEHRDGERIRLEDENGLLVAWVLPDDAARIIDSMHRADGRDAITIELVSVLDELLADLGTLKEDCRNPVIIAKAEEIMLRARAVRINGDADHHAEIQRLARQRAILATGLANAERALRRARSRHGDNCACDGCEELKAESSEASEAIGKAGRL